MRAYAAPSVARDATWLLLGRITRQATQLALMLALLRALPAAQVGQYVLVLAIANPVFVLAELGMRNVLITYPGRMSLGWYLRARLVLVLAAGAVTVVIVASATHIALSVPLAVGVARSSDSISDLVVIATQRAGDLRAASRVFMCGQVVVAVTGQVTIGVTGVRDAAIAAAACASALVAGALALLFAEPDQHSPRGTGRSVLLAGTLLGVSNAALALGTSVPQYVLAAVEGSAAVARYGVLLYVVWGVEMFWGAYTQAWLPAAVLARAGGRAGVRREVGRRVVSWTVRSVGIAALAVPLVGTVLPLILTQLTTESPAEAVLLGLTVVALPLLWFSTAGLTAANLYRQGLFNSVVAVCGTLAMSAVLVPAFGLAGALGANLTFVLTRGFAAYAQLFRVGGPTAAPVECRCT